MNTSVNNNHIESNNGMSQVINILTGETKKIRCHYISSRTDKPVSRVLTLERLNHPALTAAGVTAWAERFNDGVNSFDWLRVSIQLTDKICYTPNCANVGLPDVENYGNLDYYMGQEGAMRVSMNNVDKFFQSIADKPAKMMTGEDWPNMAVIAAYKAAGRDEEADTLTTARDIYNTRREAKNEAWRKKYAAQQYYYNSPKPKNFDELTELERAQFMMQTAQECAKDHPELDWADILENAEKRLEKANAERQERYNARCKELETEALAQMPYKVGDTVKSRDGVAGRVVEMHPEVTGDTDSPHLIYEYDGKPTVNVVILDADGKRHCAHWSFFTLQETSEIKVGDRVWCKHGEVMGTVTAIRIWNPDYAFKVRLDKPVTLFGRTFEETEFHRAGITKNYDRDGMIVGNAQYYTEQLKYGPASIIEYELAGVTLRTESTREDVEPDSREGWGNEYRVTIHHQTGDTTETMTLSETAELLARMYQKEQGKAA